MGQESSAPSHQLLQLGAAPARLRLARDGRALELDGEQFDLSRRGPLRRILLALVEARLRAPGAALSTAEVQEAGWPGERMRPESAAARVYMAIRRLRVLGLQRGLRTCDVGYVLDTRLAVEWLDGDAR
jgi:hypothetical protein